MPPKKKGGGKKKKGGGGKKKKEEVTWGEALMAYRINIKEKEIEDVRYELRALEDKNERHQERNGRLLDEQKHYMKLLLKQAREFENKLSSEPPTERDEVLKVMQDKWEAAREQEKLVAGIKEQIAKTEAEVVKERHEVMRWTEYRDKGQNTLKTQIHVLEKELQDLHENFQHMSEYINGNLEASKESISQHFEEMMDQQKYKASERAIAMMDKNSRQELIDNEWLNHETTVHREDVTLLEEMVQTLEADNLEIMEELFECNIQHLKINKDTFLTQVSGYDNLEENAQLQIDLEQLSITKKQQLKALEQADEARPVSTTFLAMERKLQKYHIEEDDASSQFEGELPTDEDPFGDYMSYDEDAFHNYLQLGPVELKLLSIRGEGMTLHKLQTPTPEEIAALDFRPEEYPVTAKAIRQVLAA